MTRYAPEDYHGQHDPDDFDPDELEKMRSEFEQSEDDESDLPEHKRSDYAERMAEKADILRKEQRETWK